MEFDILRIWLPVSLVLHLLMLPLLGHIYLPKPKEHITTLTIISLAPTSSPATAQAGSPREPAPAPKRATPPKTGITRPAQMEPVTLKTKPQATSELGGLRHGLGGMRQPGNPASIQRGLAPAPSTGGGAPARLAAPQNGPLGRFGTPDGMQRDIGALPHAGPNLATSDRGSWAATPGSADGTGRIGGGLDKSGPGEIGYMPRGGQTAYATRGTSGPTASAPTSARAGTVIAGGNSGAIRPGGGGGGLERDIRGLPGGSDMMTGSHGEWSVRPGNPDGTGNSPIGIVRATPGAGHDRDGTGGTIIASGRTTGPGPGGAGGGTDRGGVAGQGDRPGPGTGRNGIDRDVRGLPGGGGGTGRGSWGDTASGPGGDGPGGTGSGAGRAGVTCGASFGDGGEGIAFDYPTLAVMEGLEGTIALDAVLNADGIVADKKAIKVTKGTSYDSLNNAAIRAVERLHQYVRISPALKNGQPVDSKVHFKIIFAKGEAKIFLVP